MSEVQVWTDGSCWPNPGGPGGYGVVLIYGQHRAELSGGYRASTNNRMELMGAIKALEALTRRCNVVLHSDSQYVVNGIGWSLRWRNKEWKGSDGNPVKNRDLWEQLLVLTERHVVEFKWIRGHNGTAENEVCDVLAGEAAKGQFLEVDHGFELTRLNTNQVVSHIQENINDNGGR